QTPNPIRGPTPILARAPTTILVRGPSPTPSGVGQLSNHHHHQSLFQFHNDLEAQFMAFIPTPGLYYYNLFPRYSSIIT
ncbi:hypothetical protein L195_g058647, partial [Trifolium pratense]